ncbi:regulatory protein GemA [Deltaproteobacteria bacterium Smac51]|nr:regulatory protein GemA [Deltaproteobacteria bacterium Smac51]
MAVNGRRGMLAKIHIAKKDLGLTDADYRHVLTVNYNVESAADLTDEQLNDLLNLFKQKGWKPLRKDVPADGNRRDSKPPVPKDRQPLVNKIEALLSEKGRLEGRRVSWKYAEAILKKQGGPDYLNWATVQQLENVVRALYYAVERIKRKAGG